MPHILSPTRCVFRLLTALLVAVVFALGNAPLAHADTATLPVDAKELARISDSDLRKIVADQLRPPTKPKKAFNPADLAFSFQSNLTKLRARAAEIFGTYGEVPAAFTAAYVALSQGKEENGLFSFFAILLASLAAGVVAEWVVRLARPRSTSIEKQNTITLRSKAVLFLRRFTVNLRNIAVFGAVATAVFFLLFDGDTRDNTTFAFYLAAIIVIRFTSDLFTSYLSPAAPEQRIPLYSDAEARGMLRGMQITVTLGAFGFFTCALFGVLGVHGDVHLLLLILVGTVLASGLAFSFIFVRAGIERDLCIDCHGAVTYRAHLRAWIAQAWPWLLSIGTVVIWIGLVVAGMFGHTPLFGAGLATVFCIHFWSSIDAACERDALRARQDGDSTSPAIVRVIRIALGLCLTFALISMWRINLFSFSDGGIGTATAAAVLQIGVILLCAYALWQTLTIWIDRRIVEERAKAGDLGDISEMEIGGRGLSRIATLLPLFKRSSQVAISVMTFMLVVSALGISIGPLLAGAGVVGLAIGFGSQTLVRDIVSGAFFLIDDAFRLGEYIDLGSVKGTVEAIAVRSLQLRHHRGALNTIPFGEISTVKNYSRDWVIMKLKFRVSFDTDIEKVRKVIKAVGRELLEREDIGDDFLQPLKSQGVVETDDYGLIIRMKFMSEPGKQFIIRRHAFAAVQDAFEANGIEFSVPELKVAVDNGDMNSGASERNDATGNAVGAAALRTVSKAQAAEKS